MGPAMGVMRGRWVLGMVGRDQIASSLYRRVRCRKRRFCYRPRDTLIQPSSARHERRARATAQEQPHEKSQEKSREMFFEGIGHFEAGRLEPARECFERCLALTPDRPSVLGNLGITLFHLGRTREALPYLQRATAGDASFADAWGFLGMTHAAEGAWLPALDALNTSLALADRSASLWFAKAQCLMRLGRAQEALPAFDRAVEIDPGHAAAWSGRGGLLRELHRFDAAAHSFERAIALGADRELHDYYLAAVRKATAAPRQAPRQYVEALFDDYAAEFQGHVVEQLGYRGHEELLRPIVASGQRFHSALDLGCGTGLCAPLLAQCSDMIVGVDISKQMIEQAGRRGAYRELVHADLVEFLAATTLQADLVVAADVLIYVGDLAAVFDGVARVLRPGGLFAFSVERSRNDEDLQLLPSLRYAHGENALRKMAAACGLQVQTMREAPIRCEQRNPVLGMYVVSSKAAAQ